MSRIRGWKPLIAALSLGILLGAAPPTPSYYGVERTIDRLRADWAKPGAPTQPNGPGWNTFFDALRTELRAYATSPTDDQRLRSLGRLYEMSVALRGVGWGPAVEVRDELRAWLRPRVQLAWAERRLLDSVRGLPDTSDPSARANRDRWVQFVENDLGTALRNYDATRSIAERMVALERIRAELDSLRSGNAARPWGPSLALQSALDDLYSLPNLDVTADPNSLAQALSRPIVEGGPITFKGRTSYVTPGPMTGFGLLPSNDGIAFYNSQLLTSVTPIDDFQQQLAQDRKGKRAAKMYQFGAASTNHAQLTITAILRPSGLVVAPGYLHNISATVNSLPIQGKGFGRFVASLLGFNQARITDQVLQGSIEKIKEGVVQGSAELAQIKAGQGAEQQNARIAQFLLGPNAMGTSNFGVSGLSLQSRPEYALIGGTIFSPGSSETSRADMPQPPKFATFQPGVVADVHLASALNNLISGYVNTADVKAISNVMIVTHDVPPGTPPQQAMKVTQNADFPTYLKEVETSSAANNPKVAAIRIFKPEKPPEFAADAQGNLVVLIRDFRMEVPAPPSALRGGLSGPPARIYRITAPVAEIAVSFKIAPAVAGALPRLTGEVVSFDTGPGARVTAILDDEAKATQLNAFTSTFVLGVLSSRFRGRPIDVALGSGRLGKFALGPVSPLDPSGWMRVVLVPAG